MMWKPIWLSRPRRLLQNEPKNTKIGVRNQKLRPKRWRTCNSLWGGWTVRLGSRPVRFKARTKPFSDLPSGPFVRHGPDSPGDPENLRSRIWGCGTWFWGWKSEIPKSKLDGEKEKSGQGMQRGLETLAKPWAVDQLEQKLTRNNKSLKIGWGYFLCGDFWIRQEQNKIRLERWGGGAPNCGNLAHDTKWCRSKPRVWPNLHELEVDLRKNTKNTWETHKRDIQDTHR